MHYKNHRANREVMSVILSLLIGVGLCIGSFIYGDLKIQKVIAGYEQYIDTLHREQTQKIVSLEKKLSEKPKIIYQTKTKYRIVSKCCCLFNK